MRGVSVFAFGIGIFIVLAGIVSAECASDQIIMKLNSSTNTHGALWNYEGYSSTICYSSLFIEPYTGTNPHSCNSDDSNVVLKLYAAANSHAASKDSNVYNERVCHKGLSDCETIAKSGGSFSCPSQKYPIVYLFSLTNSHIYTSPTGANFVVCCKSASAPLPPPIEITECSQLTTEAQCNQNIAVGQTDSGCTPSSGDKSICFCKWNGTRCNVEWESSWEECSYKCIIESAPETDCVEDYQIMRLSARTVITDTKTECIGKSIPVDVSGCRSGSATVYCGRGEVQLPFFGAWQMIAGLSSIAVVYILLGRKNLL